MKRTGIFILAAAFAAAAMVAAPFVMAAADQITIKGSTTVLPIAQSCAEAFMAKHPNVNISVQGGGSGVGVSSVIDGTADIGDASRAAKDKEIAKGKENGVELKANVVAMDGIAVIIHPRNPVTGLTKDQIKAVYTGKISNWKDVGGDNARIVVISRDSSSGTFETFNELALHKERVRPDALMNASNNAVVQTVANTPGAIGYCGIGYIRDTIKTVPVDGVECTKPNVINGSYGLARKLFMYTNGEAKGLVAGFLDFIMSADGQKLVDKAGFVAFK
jgi:phosphate transport system substrate-binding protein